MLIESNIAEKNEQKNWIIKTWRTWILGKVTFFFVLRKYRKYKKPRKKCESAYKTYKRNSASGLYFPETKKLMNK